MDTSKLVHRKFVVKPGKYNFSELVMRETCGMDEQQAARTAEKSNNAMAMATEMVRLSIVAVDGEQVVQPFFTFDTWSTKTRQFVLKAYEMLNSIDDSELLDFQQASTEVPQAALAKAARGQ